MYTGVLSACPLLGGLSFVAPFIRGFTVYSCWIYAAHSLQQLYKFQKCGREMATQTLMPAPSRDETTIDELSAQFSQLCQAYVPSDFLVCASAGMKNLAESGRSNVIYKLAKGVGTKRQNQEDSLFPTSRMPMGLFEYATDFFLCENMNQVCYK